MTGKGRRNRFGLGWRVVGLGLLLTLPAQAEDTALVSSSREIAKQGVLAYDAGDYERAEQLFAKAYQVVQVPTLALYRARALEKMGRLVEAGEAYRVATKLSTESGDKEVQEQAKREAGEEREALMPRIPRLLVEVQAPDPTKVTVQVDQREVPPAILSAGLLVDPGAHEVTGKLGKEVATQQVTLAEGARTRVVLRLQGNDKEAASPHSGEESQTLWSKIPALGWVGFGVGALGFGAGAGTGIWALSRSFSIRDEHCNGDDRCDRAAKDEVSSAKTVARISNVAWGVGVVGVGVGVFAVLSHRDEAVPSATLRQPGFEVGRAHRVRLSPEITGQGLLLTGEF